MKDAEALLGVTRQPKVHARLEKLELRPTLEDAMQRHFEARLEKKREVGKRCEVVEPAHPLGRTPPHRVARERGEDVAIAQHEVARAQQRHELPFVSVREIRRVDEAERRRREQGHLLALARRGLHEVGRIPLAEEDLQPLQLEPALEQVNLCGLARAIQPLDRDEPAREAKFCKRLHQGRESVARAPTDGKRGVACAAPEC